MPRCRCDHWLHLRYLDLCALDPRSTPLTQVPGTTTIFRYGAGPNGIMRTLGQYMAASGATFGFVGTPRRILLPS